MRWLQKLYQEVKIRKEAQKDPYPNPKSKYFPRIRVRSYGGELKLLEEKYGIW